MRRWIALGAAGLLVALSLPFVRAQEGFSLGLAKRAPTTAGETRLAVLPHPLHAIDLSRIDARGEVATAPAHRERVAELTVDPNLQRAANRLLREGAVAEGAIVLTDVKTGRVLAWSSYSTEAPSRDVATEAFAPSASVFKIVTGAALVENGLSPSTRECYRGGKSRIDASELERDPKRDKWCATLAEAMGRSLNVVFARLASDHLDRDELTSVATRLGWARDVPFDVPVQQSRIDLPEDPTELVRTAAGFWNTTMSPFQGANLATTIANGGEMIQLHVVDRVRDGDSELYRGPSERHVLGRVIEERTARAVTSMMEATVDGGTSYRSFHDRAGRAYLPETRVAGKTGTLEGKGYLFTWFVGFAPSDAPEVAISVLVANRGDWKVKGTDVAADMLRAYFASKGRKGVVDPFGTKAPRG